MNAPRPFVHFKKTNTHANRGVECEKAVQTALEAWQAADSKHREFNRLLDTKAARRTIKAAPADFEFFDGSDPHEPVHGLIEAKQTKHDYRLDRDKVSQLARLRKRGQCGGVCFVIVLHSEIEKFRCIPVSWLAENGDKGSWNLSEFQLLDTAHDALKVTGL